MSGYPAVAAAAIVSLAAHFAVGAAKSLVTVRSWWSSGLEMTVVGAVEGVVTYLIGVGNFPHIVAGSVEAFMLVANGELGIGALLGGFMLPVLAGNIVGGTVLFALISYAQVMKEL